MIVVEVAVERLQFAVSDEAEFVTGGTQQAAVVRDDEHGAVVVLQRQGEGITHGEVEVVGGFVKQQQVRALRDDEGEGKARFFAA